MVLVGDRLDLNRVICWWMPTCTGPQATDRTDRILFRVALIVQIQSIAGGPSHGCPTNDLNTISTPAEMLCPNVFPWIEDGNLNFSLRIDRRD
jgi:hypothetical protein